MKETVNSGDFYLDILISMAKGKAEMPITLMLNGLIISGILISSDEYFKLFADGIIKEIIDKHIESGKIKAPSKDDENQSEASGEEETDEINTKFIHLKDAQIFTPGQNPVPNNVKMLWRGKISSVDGYWLGSMTAVREAQRP
jgi:hypothetical protein